MDRKQRLRFCLNLLQLKWIAKSDAARRVYKLQYDRMKEKEPSHKTTA